MRVSHRTESILIPASESKMCSMCGDHAHYVEISFESPICSIDCAKQMWKLYVDTQVSRQYKISEFMPKDQV
ncbi:hypothetical protein IC620_00085 [Hazenella sp. IB182357]|uniref:Uncharacterized protein n=1 Tax=Polycladospora coralii TaxID=2771432 RepID=A0A926NC91_9BACL|nr:hypothetical protein [Polycladospora coralii]MBD1370758.1 hypothetical protein [Polycladospora coralii]MBS7529696.1 hypothetical protein [Polycladospora coralii]